jgi:FdhE protein
MDITDSAKKAWIEGHPYLEGVASFQALVERAAAAVPPTARRLDVARWAPDRARGVPLLRSDRAALDVSTEGGEAMLAVAQRIASADVPDGIRGPAGELAAVLRRSPAERARVVSFVVTGEGDASPGSAGMTRYLGWNALARVLAPVVAEVSALRDEVWSSGECPTCGAPPPMAFLADEGGARARHLACGCCRTRWKYRRVACPFCGSEDARQLGVLEIDREPTLRLDVCDGCKGYVKTYTAAGEEDFFLADWPTLHLDVLARDRGYERRGASLFALE